MKTPRMLRWALLFCSGLTVSVFAAAPSRPNIIFLLADNLGCGGSARKKFARRTSTVLQPRA